MAAGRPEMHRVDQIELARFVTLSGAKGLFPYDGDSSRPSGAQNDRSARSSQFGHTQVKSYHYIAKNTLT
jgi:hypothetical protein